MDSAAWLRYINEIPLSVRRVDGIPARRARQIKKGSSPAGKQRGLFCRRAGIPSNQSCGVPGKRKFFRGETARRARQIKKEAVRRANSTGFFDAFGFLILILINLQKAATCAWLFAPLKGPVCAKGVHAAPCENSQKWICHFCEESAGFFVVCTKKCLLVTQRHNL